MAAFLPPSHRMPAFSPHTIPNVTTLPVLLMDGAVPFFQEDKHASLFNPGCALHPRKGGNAGGNRHDWSDRSTNYLYNSTHMVARVASSLSSTAWSRLLPPLSLPPPFLTPPPRSVSVPPNTGSGTGLKLARATRRRGSLEWVGWVGGWMSACAWPQREGIEKQRLGLPL